MPLVGYEMTSGSFWKIIMKLPCLRIWGWYSAHVPHSHALNAQGCSVVSYPLLATLPCTQFLQLLNFYGKHFRKYISQERYKKKTNSLTTLTMFSTVNILKQSHLLVQLSFLSKHTEKHKWRNLKPVYFILQNEKFVHEMPWYLGYGSRVQKEETGAVQVKTSFATSLQLLKLASY